MARHPAKQVEQNIASVARKGAGGEGTKRPWNPRESIA